MLLFVCTIKDLVVNFSVNIVSKKKKKHFYNTLIVSFKKFNMVALFASKMSEMFIIISLSHCRSPVKITCCVALESTSRSYC